MPSPQLKGCSGSFVEKLEDKVQYEDTSLSPSLSPSPRKGGRLGGGVERASVRAWTCTPPAAQSKEERSDDKCAAKGALTPHPTLQGASSTREGGGLYCLPGRNAFGLIVSLFLVLLTACGDGGGGGPGGGTGPAPSYVEAGLLAYDSYSFGDSKLLAQSQLSSALQADLQKALADVRKDLPDGFKVLIKAFWKSVANADNYRVYLRERNQEWKEIALVPSTQTEWTSLDVRPQFDLVDGKVYEVGIAAVIAGQTGSIKASWPLAMLGGVRLNAPQDGGAASVRPTFQWVNARGNPTAVEVSVVNNQNQIVLSGFWNTLPLNSNATPNQDLPGGNYRWLAINASTSQAATDPRTKSTFPSGYMVLTLPRFSVFKVGGGTNPPPPPGPPGPPPPGPPAPPPPGPPPPPPSGTTVGPGSIAIFKPTNFQSGQITVSLPNFAATEQVVAIPVYATQELEVDGFNYSLNVQGVSPASVQHQANPPELLHQELDPYHKGHLEFLAKSQRIMEEHRRLKTEGKVSGKVKTQAFDKCRSPYPVGSKKCQFWIGGLSPEELVNTTLRFESQNAYWFVDDRDQSDFSEADLSGLAQKFEQITVPSNTRYFGNFSDFDKNGKIIIIFSRVLGDGLLGYVAPWDTLPDGALQGVHSNEGDYFYANTPTGTSSFYSRSDYFTFMPSTITHELKHLIGSGIATQTGNPWEELWIEEGSAVAAQELAQQGTQIGLTFNRPRFQLAEPHKYRLVYRGRPSDSKEGAGIYGYSFLFLWRIAERIGHDNFWKRWVAAQGKGVAKLEQVTGLSLDNHMLDWALTLYLDHQHGEYTYKSINLKDGRWQALGILPLSSGPGTARSIAYHRGKGSGGNAQISLQTSHSKPYLIVLRFNATGGQSLAALEYLKLQSPFSPLTTPP